MKDAILEKLDAKSLNAFTWIQQFESECKRLKVPEERNYEAIRLFVEDIANDWYSAESISLQTTSWKTWKQSFLHAFAPKGWNLARTAFSFRFLSGSLADYAIRKLNLLVHLNSKMDEETKINLIVVGLPLSVQERLDKTEIDSVGKLLSKINSFERMPYSAPITDFSPNNKIVQPSRNFTYNFNQSAKLFGNNYKSFEACPYTVKKKVLQEDFI